MKARMNRWLRGAVIVAALTALAAPAARAADKLYMWQVSSETATVTMVGSIHVGQPDFFPLAEPFEKAFAAAPVLAVEVDMTDPAVMQESMQLMMEKGMLTGDETLQTRLNPDVYERLEAYATKQGLPLAMFQKYKPGIVAMMVVMNEYTAQGFDPELGIDKHFLDTAKADGKEIVQMENVADQLDLLFEVDDKLDDVLFAEFLDQMEDVASTINEMVGYWKTGDADGMDRFLTEQVGDDPDMARFYRGLMDDRNVAMADQIAGWLEGDQDVFCVVGAGHFAGKMGIVALLEAKGLEVTQVTN